MKKINLPQQLLEFLEDYGKLELKYAYDNAGVAYFLSHEFGSSRKVVSLRMKTDDHSNISLSNIKEIDYLGSNIQGIQIFKNGFPQKYWKNINFSL